MSRSRPDEFESSEDEQSGTEREMAEEARTLMRSAERDVLIRHLQNEHHVEIRPSDIDGVGVFSLVDIARGTVLFKINGGPSSQTIPLTTREVTGLPEHVQNTLKKFILPGKDGVFHVPAHGLSCALGLGFYINSSKGSDCDANVEFGNRKDDSGYVEIVTTRDILRGEELLLPYECSNSMRGTVIIGTENGHERLETLPEDASPFCRICQEDLPFGDDSTRNIVDIGCKCHSNSRMCKGCAVTWFSQRITISLTQHRPDSEGQNLGRVMVLNEWTPGVTTTCEVCNQTLSPGFCKILLRAAAESEQASPAVVALHRNMDCANGISRIADPVAIKISKVPGYKTVRRHVSKNITTTYRYREAYQYQNLGRRSRHQNMRRSHDHGVKNNAESSSIWQQHLEPGRFSYRKAMFWMAEEKKWIPGKTHEYVPAKSRNENCECKLAVCECPKYTRGMYRYTVESMGIDEYFSDDDATVKIDGKMGRHLWQSP